MLYQLRGFWKEVLSRRTPFLGQHPGWSRRGHGPAAYLEFSGLASVFWPRSSLFARTSATFRLGVTVIGEGRASTTPGGCLAPFTSDNRVGEKTQACKAEYLKAVQSCRASNQGEAFHRGQPRNKARKVRHRNDGAVIQRSQRGTTAATRAAGR